MKKSIVITFFLLFSALILVGYVHFDERCITDACRQESLSNNFDIYKDAVLEKNNFISKEISHIKEIGMRAQKKEEYSLNNKISRIESSYIDCESLQREFGIAGMYGCFSQKEEEINELKSNISLVKLNYNAFYEKINFTQNSIGRIRKLIAGNRGYDTAAASEIYVMSEGVSDNYFQIIETMVDRKWLDVDSANKRKSLFEKKSEIAARLESDIMSYK